MDGINLLSEIHPRAVSLFNPLQQAHEWFNLFNSEDIQRLREESFSFVQVIELIELRSRQRGEVLVIRDWAHLDFTGLPFLDKPSYSLGIVNALSRNFQLIQIATVRHPLDQWLSLRHLQIMQESIANQKLTVNYFLRGYLKFARQCKEIGFVRYEDFTRGPESVMQDICGKLDVPYDPEFIRRWHEYHNITGDVTSTRGGNEIKPLERRDLNSTLQELFESDPAYAESLDLLGYSE